jgi:hypothetical protein
MKLCIHLITLASAALIISACNRSETTAPAGGAPVTPTGAAISANPNPVPAGDGLGRTTIKWATGDGTPANVVVSQDGGQEQGFASGKDGSSEASWIQSGATYEFRLYSLDRKLLAKVVVTRESK